MAAAKAHYMFLKMMMIRETLTKKVGNLPAQSRDAG